MRALFLAALLPTLAFGQAISGTFSGAFENFDSFGIPQVRLNLSLQCSLTCDASAPTLSFGVSGGVSAFYVNAPTDSAAYLSAFFGSAANGQTNIVNTDFKPGSVSFAEAKSCTCRCGNRTGEGGYITLRTPNIVVPARFFIGAVSNATEESIINLNAVPKGPETIVVTIVGAGLNSTQTFTAADFGAQGAVLVRFTPPTSGTVTVKATMQPSGVTSTETIEIKANTSSSGGGGGSTGGGGGGGGGEEEPPASCSTLGALPIAVLGLALLRRRRAQA